MITSRLNSAMAAKKKMPSSTWKNALRRSWLWESIDECRSG